MDIQVNIFNFNLLIIIENCIAKFGLTPQYDWVFDFFGGLDIEKDFNHLSNIIFSNG